MTDRRDPQEPSVPVRFENLAAMREAHAKLVTERREMGETDVFFSQVDTFIRRGTATGEWLDDAGDRRTAQGLLDYWDNFLRRVERHEIDPTLADFNPETLPDLPEESCPYLGLYAFQEKDRDFFFGRRRLIATFVQHLQDHHMLMVLGPSGSGKSSAVLAGLLPDLKNGALPGSETWRYLPVMVPGSSPLVHLAELFRPDRPDRADWVAHQVQQLMKDDQHLVNMAAAEGIETAVLVIDQFEETFTLCLNDDERDAFARNLLALAQAPDHRHRVIITLRTDFEPMAQRLPEAFQQAFDASRIRMMPMDAAELRAAILSPAERVGLYFEAGVVDGLIHDLLGEPAALPLMQFTLLRLWAMRVRNRVPMAAYRQLGGGRLALANSADELYESLIPEDQVTMRRLLLRMVRPGDGLEVTNNRIRRAMLYQSGEARDRVDRVLDKLVNARLVRLRDGGTADAQVEVAHEALIRNWPRLIDWLDEERVAMRRRLRLTTAAEQWEALGRDPSTLRRGVLLEEALSFDDLNDLERAFVEASKAAAEAEKNRELSRLRRSIILLTLFLVMAAATAVYAAVQQQRAERSAEIAVTRAVEALIAQSEAEMQRDARATAEGEANLKREQLSTRVSEVVTAQAVAEARRDELSNSLATQAALLESLLAEAATATPIPTNPPPATLPPPTQTPSVVVEGLTPRPTPTTEMVALAPISPTPIIQDSLPALSDLDSQLQGVRAAQTAVAQESAGPQTILIGSSVNGAPLQAVRFGRGPQKLLFVGGIHAGTAPSTVDLAERTIAYFTDNPDEIPSTVTLYVIPNLNPDSPSQPGSTAGRLNANGVDLNRNWDCAWKEDPMIRGAVVAGGGGSEVLSEPESKALHDFVRQINPQAVVIWFAFATNGLVVPGGCPDTLVSTNLGVTYGLAAGYNTSLQSRGVITVAGDVTNWLDSQEIPTVGVLLPSYYLPDWDNNLPAIRAVINAFQ